MRTFITTFLFFAFSHAVFSQSGLKYNIVGSGGFLVNNQENGIKAEVLQGIYLNNWTLGLGAAWDSYEKKSVPVYAEIKRFLPGKNAIPFIYGNTGVNLVKKQLTDNNWQTIYNKDGIYYEGGLGLKFNRQKIKFYLSGGYSHKAYTKRFDVKNLPPATDYNWTEEKYKYNRYIIKLGIGN